jgi:ABC-type nitrate/sulfonate/bicarbonate transport system permease component
VGVVRRMGRRTARSIMRTGTLLTLVSLAIFCMGWELYATPARSFAIAPPSKVLPALVEIVSSGDVFGITIGTLSTTFIGFALSAVFGVLIGCLLGLVRPFANAFEPLINAFNAAPLTAMIPLIAVYVGFDADGRVAVVILWTIFVIIVNTVTGIRSVPPEYINVARAFCARPLHIVTMVILPAAFPHMLTGLTLGIGRAFRGALAAETLLAVANLGRYLKNANATFDIPQVYARTLYVVLLGLLLVSAAEIIQRRLERRPR